MPETRNATHPLAGKTVRLKPGRNNPQLDGAEFRVEDTWINVAGKSWGVCDGNPACLNFAVRTGFGGISFPLPDDANVLYGKVGPFGHLIHASEIDPASIP